MVIKYILNLIKQLDKIDTQSLLGHYSSKYVWGQISEIRRRQAGWKPKEEIIEQHKKQECQKFYSILNKLKSQGFVKKINNDEKKTSLWKLTKKGLDKLLALESQSERLSAIKSDQLEKDQLKIITFDIPESQKQYRDWLRQTLINFNFKKLQKSVWMGDTKLPEIFLHTLRNYRLLDCVHIFSVKNRGTLL